MMAPVAYEPVVVCVPLHPPEAVHEVALVLDQVKVLLAPLDTLFGLALKVTVGAGVDTVTVAA